MISDRIDKKRDNLYKDAVQTKEDYCGLLWRSVKLRRLRELADTLGEIGTDLRKDAERAENQCKDCIYRFNNVNESLKDRDYRHIKHQMLFVSR